MVGEGVERKLFDAASKGDVRAFRQLLEEDPYLVHVASFPCSRNLLHIATMCGHEGIVEEVTVRNGHLTRNLDSQNSSALHISAAKGSLEIAKKLVFIAPEMCWARDSQGMNPVHIAAMNGHVEVLKELIREDPFPAMEKLDRGQTVLHLCVKHRRDEAFKLLVKELGELVYAEDDDGETILHSAVRFKQVEVVRFLVQDTKIEKVAKCKGKTVAEICSESSPDDTAALEIKELLGRTTLLATPPADVKNSDHILKKYSEASMVVLILIATMAFQATVSPPGGVWQDNSSPPHKAGEAVMASARPLLFNSFKGYSTLAFFTSIFAIVLNSVGFTSQYTILMGVVYCIIGMSMLSISVSYVIAMSTITPGLESRSTSDVTTPVYFGFSSFSAIVIILIFLVRKWRSRIRNTN